MRSVRLRVLIKGSVQIVLSILDKKEALPKATGKGISFPIETVRCSLVSGSVLSPVILPGNNEEGSCLYVQDLFPGDDYVAAIAVDNVDFNISC